MESAVPGSSSSTPTSRKNFRIGDKRRLQFPHGRAERLQSPGILRCIPNSGGGRIHGRSGHRHADHRRLQHLGHGQQSAVSTTAAGTTIYNKCVNMVNAQKTTAGALPADFFPPSSLDRTFYAKAATSYDITTLSGYKLYSCGPVRHQLPARCITAARLAYIQFGVSCTSNGVQEAD